tara:strand:- start:614 stop:832 length:219 start_codon:yes stop_codon:yes gene_type:complete
MINKDLISNEEIITSKIKQARMLLNDLNKCIEIIDMLDDGNLYDQLLGKGTATSKASFFIERLETVHGVKYE